MVGNFLKVSSSAVAGCERNADQRALRRLVRNVYREHDPITKHDPRLIAHIAPAVAKAAMETGVARKKIDIDEYREKLAYRLGKGEQIRYFIMNKAKATKGTKRGLEGQARHSPSRPTSPTCPPDPEPCS